MKRVTNGFNQDTTSTVVAWLAANKQLIMAELYLIGERDDPNALWYTNWESPLLWSMYGTFLPATIKRSNISSRVGLEVTKVDITLGLLAADVSEDAASVYDAARDGTLDGWPVRIWTVYMPTFGDCDTLGCSELFGGRIGEIEINRGSLKLSCNSFLALIDQDVPNQLIEATNPMLAFEESPTEDYSFPYVPSPAEAL
jgi:hypothetical protein